MPKGIIRKLDPEFGTGLIELLEGSCGKPYSENQKPALTFHIETHVPSEEDRQRVQIGAHVNVELDRLNLIQSITVLADVEEVGPIIPPYHFVPVDLNNAVCEQPVFHDGKQSGRRLSGELRCTLTALTPLIVGNDQYSAEDANRTEPAAHDLLYLKDPLWGINIPVKKNKKIIEPLRLENGLIVLPSSSLKGMLRQSLGALLAAPMERVGERTYSYRPNLGFAEQGRYRCYPAVVKEISNTSVKVAVLLEQIPEVIFVENRATGHLSSSTPKPEQKLLPKEYLNVKYFCNNKQKIGFKSNTSWLPTREYKWFFYKVGIDGAGKLAGNEKYKYVLMPSKNFNDSKTYLISEGVLNQYHLTQDHLKNKTTGHLRSDYPNPIDKKIIADSIEENRDLVVGQLIYVEIDCQEWRIVSFGHHFRYRWRYADSVHKRWTEEGSQPRAILRPLPDELQLKQPLEKHSPPEKISGARLFFGYVSESLDTASGPNNPGSAGIGRGDFQRLAGRIAINMAVEQTDKPEEDSRFINDGKLCLLKPLSSPRPSAVEFYLGQSRIQARSDGGTMVTYGDLPGMDQTGELNGRKFYLHQSDASAVNKSLFSLDLEAEEALQANPNYSNMDRQLLKLIQEDQTSFTRFISNKGTQFLFTIRFQELDDWELGALLLALDPNGVNDLVTHLDYLPGVQKYLNYLDKLSPKDDHPRFAHKLGHGRPLGLGSVRIKIDDLYCWDGDKLTKDEEEKYRKAMQKLANKWKKALVDRDSNSSEQMKIPKRRRLEQMLIQWLKVHQYCGRSRAEYPGVSKKEPGYKFHTSLRIQHAEGRRGWTMPEPSAKTLKPL
jgi:CRISPR-associated protein (TIGR03986 family)